MKKWIAKKFVLGLLNKFMDQYTADLAKAKNILNLWISRLQKVLGCLQSILGKLEDNQLDENEVDQTVEEIKAVVEGW